MKDLFGGVASATVLIFGAYGLLALIAKIRGKKLQK